MHYTGTIWRPPYEAGSLLLEVTAGCSHRKCKFCTLYEDLEFGFRITPMSVAEEDLREAQMYYCSPLRQLENKLLGKSEAGIKRVFLTGANPFVLKFERLMEISGLIRKYFPKTESIGCFARITDVGLKSDEELEELKKAGYEGLTIGMETGDDEALKFMNKGYNSEEIIRQCKRLERAGIGYNLFYLTGISGKGRGEKGAEITAKLCSILRPKLIGANMLTVYKNSELYEEIKRGIWEEESETEKYRELRTLIEGLKTECKFAALGASNAVQLYGELPNDRGELLRRIDAITEKIGEEELRRYRRELKHL